MADEATEAEEAEVTGSEEEGDGEAEGKSKGRFGGKLNKKKLLMFGLLVLLALGGGGYYGASMFGLLGGSEDLPQAAAVQNKVYYDLPEMVVNLSSGDKRRQYLKLKVSLEAESRDDLRALEPVLPRILDTFQLYLRELRSSDLEGSAGIFRLKEELLRRINIEIQPYQVSRVLFKEIIVQ